MRPIMSVRPFPLICEIDSPFRSLDRTFLLPLTSTPTIAPDRSLSGAESFVTPRSVAMAAFFMGKFASALKRPCPALRRSAQIHAKPTLPG
jgi:hypothetical protein